MNSKKLLRNHGTLRFFSTAVADPEEEHRGPSPSSVFLKVKDSTHTFNNNGQNCIECELNDLPCGHMHDHHLLDDIVTSYSSFARLSDSI